MQRGDVALAMGKVQRVSIPVESDRHLGPICSIVSVATAENNVTPPPLPVYMAALLQCSKVSALRFETCLLAGRACDIFVAISR